MANPWYDYPYVADIGTPDPYGGFPKPDINFQVPNNTPITALYGGVISGIDTAGSGAIPAYGHVVTVKLHQPLNGLATHTAYLHLTSIAPGLTVGSQVRTGDVLGYGGSGSGTPPGTQPAPVGFYSCDYYGQGSAWSNETSANLAGALNPVPIIDAARGNLAGLLGGVGGGVGGGIGSLFPGPTQSITDYLNQNVPLLAIRTGLFLAALLLIIFGFWILTRNPVEDVKGGISTGLNVATEGAFGATKSALTRKPEAKPEAKKPEAKPEAKPGGAKA